MTTPMPTTEKNMPSWSEGITAQTEQQHLEADTVGQEGLGAAIPSTQLPTSQLIHFPYSQHSLQL